MRLNKALEIANRDLKNSHISSYSLDSRILLGHVLGFSKEKIIANPDFRLNPFQEEKFFKLIKRRINREPISHLIGKREFFGNDFVVNRQVLDPRPDSETLIEAILKEFPDRKSPLKILELGVGSGCLILTILKKFPASSGIAIDIKQEALEIAKTNSKMLDIQGRIKFIRSNWFEKLKKDAGEFDLIISNPPYIPSLDINNLEEEVKKYEPRTALDGGKDGLDCYRQISKEIKDFLKNEAILILEIGQNQEQEVTKIFEEIGLKLTSSKKDLAGIIRCLIFKKI